MNKEELLKHSLENIKKGQNSLVYKKNIFKLVKELEKSYLTVYINELTPVKNKLIQLINEIQTYRERKVPKESELTRMTTEDLKQMLFKKASGIKVVIAFNHFERLTATTARFWHSVTGHQRIIFIGSLFSSFKKEAYAFYKTFEVINEAEMKEQSPAGEMDFTLPTIIICGALIFICFLKISYIGSETLIAAIWFAFLLTRTLLYLAR